jgi:two-component system, LytTR family, response regulator
MSTVNISAIIVDDAAQARKLLRLMLAEIANDINIVGEAATVEEAVAIIQATKPDVVFLDIEMPGKSGFQLAAELSQNKVPYEIIFTTAYNEYAIRAFRLAAIDYLLKPINENQLAEAIDKLRKIKWAQQTELRLQSMIQNFKNEKQAILSVPSLNGYNFLKVTEILYIKASGSYAEIHIAGKATLTVSKNLKYFESALESFVQFVRVHRSCLININQMKRFDKADRGLIVMNDDAEIDLARERREPFFKLIEK